MGELEKEIIRLREENERLQEELTMAVGVLYLLKRVEGVDTIKVDSSTMMNIHSDMISIDLTNSYDYIGDKFIYKW